MTGVSVRSLENTPLDIGRGISTSMPDRASDLEAGANALRAQIERLHECAYAWALSCCSRNRALADDVLQESYAKVIAGRARFAGRSNFKTWLFGVIRHTAHEQQRRHRWRTLGVRLRDWVGLTAEAPSAEHAIAASERAHVLEEALALLPDRQREVLHLVFYEELSLAEAAATLEISLGAARQHYHRGKLRLIDRLKDDERLEMDSSHE